MMKNNGNIRIAVIDLGTNTFNLLVAEVNSVSHYRILYNTKMPVQLGKGGINNKNITPEAMQRGIDTLRKYLHRISAYNVEKIYAFATSAVRSADNGYEFAARVKNELGLEIEIISGDKEAELIYYGVKLGTRMNEETSMIMDIGGGSTEFVICNNQQIFWKKSFDIGAARMLESFCPGDPVTTSDIEAIENYLLGELGELFAAVKQHDVSMLIGSSGSFDTFAEIIAHKFYEPSIIENITEYTFEMDDFRYTHQLMIASSKEQRLATPGLIPMRVDMIVIASIFVNLILNRCNLSKMKLSAYSLKEGVLNELISGVLVEEAQP
jgi:exopolyphosphatase / guanosine-5'-triphosphate,3'-diphosphate pyrophosphatase